LAYNSHTRSFVDCPSHIPLNPGMVSIIGQKGSCKSALADLIAYAAVSSIDSDDNCFLDRADPHLDSMTITLQWADGSVTTQSVGDEHSALAQVRYLSQDYVERICARDGITREFVRVIEQVIFNNLDPVETLNASDFSELRSIKTASMIAESERLRAEIASIRSRQVIVITHNPNLFVNADTEQVVVATAEKLDNGLPTISYVSGSLENRAIRHQVCNILEGGNGAFLKRERRYAMSRRA